MDSEYGSAPEEDFSKHSTEDLICHSKWNARQQGYKAALKLFGRLDPPDKEWNPYLALVKKFPLDPHANALSDALDVLLVFVENAAVANKTAGEVVPNLIAKCIGHVKQKVKDKAQEIILMYVEIEQQVVVMECLVAGMSNKNPKVAKECIACITNIVHQFGSKAAGGVKLAVKQIAGLMKHANVDVRVATKAMAIEFYRWVGDALKTQLQDLQAIQLTELQTGFSAIAGEPPPQPSRYLRSHKPKECIAVVAADGSPVVASPAHTSSVAAAPAETDPFDLLDPFDVVAKLPANFHEALESKKWLERKEPLDQLDQLIQQNPKLEPKAQYGEIVNVLKRVIAKDNNINVAASATKCMTGIALGLRKKFGQYATTVAPALFEKLKEKKPVLKDPLAACIDAVAKSTTIETLLEDIISALENKNPNIKIQTGLFLQRTLKMHTQQTLPKKTIKLLVPPLVKNTGDSDAEVREAASAALGSAMKAVGEKTLLPFLCDIAEDKLKMTKIKDFFEAARQDSGNELVVSMVTSMHKTNDRKGDQAASSRPPAQNAASEDNKTPLRTSVRRTQPPKIDRTVEDNAETETLAEESEATTEADDSTSEELDFQQRCKIADAVPRKNISEDITDALLGDMSTADWKVRLAAVEKLQAIVRNAKHIKSDVGGLPDVLRARFVESNKNINQNSLQLASELATAMGPRVKEHIPIWLPGIITVLADSKAQLRQLALSTLNVFVEQCGFRELIEGEIIADALKNPSPNLKSELLKWVSSNVMASKRRLPADGLKACIGHLFVCIEDRSPDVRKQAQDAVLPFMIVCGYAFMRQESEKLKGTSVTAVQALLDKARPNLPSKPTATAKSQQHNVASGVSRMSAGGKAKQPATPGVSRGASQTRKPGESTSSKKDDFEGGALINTKEKGKRALEEKQLKLLKWNFVTPGEEHIEQLKLQLATVAKPALHSYLFHSDFRQHLKAVEILLETLETNSEATLGCSDLLFRWCTLRFFDTNPSVLLKCLEFLQSFLQLFRDTNTTLEDSEVSALVPYLLLKAGEPKDVVRNGVRQILQHIYCLYPASKVFPLIVEGLKTKNSRQKAVCLEQLESLVLSEGPTVCGPLQPALKVMAASIGDRDNAVRNAALNSVVAVYLHLQDKERLYKLIGAINNKDSTLLEERIKRSAKTLTAPIIKKPAPPSPPTASANSGRPSSATGSRSTTPSRRPPQQNGHVSGAEDGGEEKKNAVVNSGMFQLELDKVCPDYNRSTTEETAAKLPDLVDMTEIEEMMKKPVTLPQVSDRSSLTQRSASMQSMTSMDASMALDSVVSQVMSGHITSAMQAVVQVDEILKDEGKASLMSGKSDQLLTALYFQLRLICTSHMQDDAGTDVIQLYQAIGQLLCTMLQNTDLAKEASDGPLKDLSCQLLTVLLDDRLSNLPNGDKVVRSINLIVVKVVEKANPTACLIAFMRLLRETLHSQTCSNKFIELVMKCLWRMTRRLPELSPELQMARVLAEIHQFYVDFPMASWRDRQSDTPSRTIKTILSNLVKGLGDKILDYVDEIPRTSDTIAYINKLLRDGQAMPGQPLDEPNEPSQQPPMPQSSKAFSASSLPLTQRLAEIFKKIGDKENSKKGIEELYEFREAHPTMDIAPFLRKSTPLFKEYVDRSLEIVAEQRRRYRDAAGDQSNAAGQNYFDRTKELRERAGMPPSKLLRASAPTAGGSTAVVGSSPAAVRSHLDQIRARIGIPSTRYKDDGSNKEESELDLLPSVKTTSGALSENNNKPPNPEESTRTDTEPQPKVVLDNIRKRLEMVKKGSQF